MVEYGQLVEKEQNKEKTAQEIQITWQKVIGSVKNSEILQIA